MMTQIPKTKFSPNIRNANNCLRNYIKAAAKLKNAIENLSDSDKLLFRTLSITVDDKFLQEYFNDENYEKMKNINIELLECFGKIVNVIDETLSQNIEPREDSV
jgi:hypothetical protein